MKYSRTVCSKKFNKILVLLSVLLVSSVQTRIIIKPYSALIVYYTATSSLRNPVLWHYILNVHTDNLERIVNYNFPEPVYIIRLSNHGLNAASDVQNHEMNELVKAQEAHFRAWSLQQYQVLKLEIDALIAECKEPSTEMLLRFIPLHKIAHTVDYSTIANLPDVKHIREEHNKIWQNVRISDLENLNKASNQDKLNALIDKFGEEQLKASDGRNTKLNEINTIRGRFDENPESVHGKPEHVSHNHRHGSLHEQNIKYEHLNKTDVNRILKEPTLNTSTIDITTETSQANIMKKIENANDITEMPEVSFGARIDSHTSSTETINQDDFGIENQDSTSTVNPQMELDLQTTEFFTDEVPETTESQTTIVDVFETITQLKIKNTTKNEIEKLIFNAPQIYVPQQVIDAEKIQRARDEHLGIVNAAILKAKLINEKKFRGKT